MLRREGLNGPSLTKATETMTELMESRPSSSGTSYQDSQCCSFAVKSQIYRAVWEKHQKLSHEEFSLCQCSTTFPVTIKTNKKNVWQMPKSSPYLQRDLVLDSGHLLVQVPKRNGILWKRNSPQGIWDCITDEMLLEFAESGCPIFRARTPLSRGSLKSKGPGKLSIHFAADQDTIGTIFRIIAFTNQLSLYGAVANMFEECETLYGRSGELDVLMGQSIVLSEILAKVPSVSDIPEHQNLQVQIYEERIELLSQEDEAE